MHYEDFYKALQNYFSGIDYKTKYDYIDDIVDKKSLTELELKKLEAYIDQCKKSGSFIVNSPSSIDALRKQLDYIFYLSRLLVCYTNYYVTNDPRYRKFGIKITALDWFGGFKVGEKIDNVWDVLQGRQDNLLYELKLFCNNLFKENDEFEELICVVEEYFIGAQNFGTEKGLSAYEKHHYFHINFSWIKIRNKCSEYYNKILAIHEDYTTKYPLGTLSFHEALEYQPDRWYDSSETFYDAAAYQPDQNNQDEQSTLHKDETATTGKSIAIASQSIILPIDIEQSKVPLIETKTRPVKLSFIKNLLDNVWYFIKKIYIAIKKIFKEFCTNFAKNIPAIRFFTASFKRSKYYELSEFKNSIQNELLTSFNLQGDLVTTTGQIGNRSCSEVLNNSDTTISFTL